MIKVSRQITMGRPPKLDSTSKDKVVSLWNQGKNLDFIAKEFGCSTATIRRTLKERI